MDKIINKKVSDAIEFLSPMFEADNSIDEVVLFGSQARGEANEKSDIDLAIIHHDGYNLQFGKLIGAVRDKFDVDFVYTSYDRINRATKQLDVNYWIREEGISIWKRLKNI